MATRKVKITAKNGVPFETQTHRYVVKPKGGKSGKIVVSIEEKQHKKD